MHVLIMNGISLTAQGSQFILVHHRASLCDLDAVQTPKRTRRSIVEAYGPIDQRSVNHTVIDQTKILHVRRRELPAHKMVRVEIHSIDRGVKRRGVVGGVIAIGILTVLVGDRGGRWTKNDTRLLIGAVARITNDRTFVHLNRAPKLILHHAETTGGAQLSNGKGQAAPHNFVHIQHHTLSFRAIDGPEQLIQKLDQFVAVPLTASTVGKRRLREIKATSVNQVLRANAKDPAVIDAVAYPDRCVLVASDMIVLEEFVIHV